MALALASPPSTQLRLGSSGPSVKALQLQLNDLGESLLASGQFGPRTLEAVRRFQVAKGIQPANGVVDALTERTLAELATAGNPRTIPRRPRVADWFDASSQRVTDGGESSPGDVKLVLSDGRTLTIEEAVPAMNTAYQRDRAGQPRDPEDPRDVIVGEVNREALKLGRKGYFTLSERKQLAYSLKEAFARLGEADVMAITGAERKRAVTVESE